jgi:hypothetical protein
MSAISTEYVWQTKESCSQICFVFVGSFCADSSEIICNFLQDFFMARIFAQEINFLQSLNFTAWNTLPLATVACMTQIFGLENASEMMTHTFCLKNH